MQITWNGTGAAWATQFGNSSALLEADGQRLLIDCGHTVPARLRAIGLSLRDIDAVFISHLHGDHVYGLEEWGFRNMLQWQVRPRLLIADTLAVPLWKHVLAGTMGQTCDRSCLLKDYFDVTPMLTGQTYEVGPWTLEIHPVRHVPHAHAFGVKVREGQVAAAFTCDSLADADPWFYADTACVFHDCSFAPYRPDTVHAHFEQICAYPEAFRRKTYLVHYDDSMAAAFATPEWQAALAATHLRLAEPNVCIPLG